MMNKKQSLDDEDISVMNSNGPMSGHGGMSSGRIGRFQPQSGYNQSSGAYYWADIQ